jgi:predicted metal-dependent phosphoesterase TrpH
VKTSTSDLVLASDAAIDLHLHTFYSDGVWSPEQLLDHLASEGFALAAITDHDRVDTLAGIQQLAAAKRLPVLVGVEMTTVWNGNWVDVLCYGFNPENGALDRLARDVFQRQQQNLRDVYAYLLQQGYPFPALEDNPELLAILEKPCARQPHEFVPFVEKYGYGTADGSLLRSLKEAGLDVVMTDTAAVVEAVHQDGGVCLIAHPGREDVTLFDANLLDRFREAFPIDGLEAYYPKHTAQQTSMYREYAQKYGLLVSSGSDSHGPEKKPIKYQAGLSQMLLQRLDIRVM